MEVTNTVKRYFTQQLMHWHSTANSRSLPWKSEKDPYKIWLSEVILQQTRAQQGLPYYHRFTEAFPTINDMAAADDEYAFRLWQGLGYYNRCKNMLATARYVSTELKGKFPRTYGEILNLKGIGPYTAAAIASFAYGSPHAVVDGNVYRVLSRYFGIDIPFDTTEGKKHFAGLAAELLDARDSAGYNQAIMDLGATICTPRSPLCQECPLQKKCIAYRQDITDSLPVKSKKLVIRKRYFHYLLLQWQDELWIQKRNGSDIWENLHEPFLIESAAPLDAEAVMNHPKFRTENIKYNSITHNYTSSQRLTHQIIESRFFRIDLKKRPVLTNDSGKWLNRDKLKKTAFPRTLVSFLENNLYF